MTPNQNDAPTASAYDDRICPRCKRAFVPRAKNQRFCSTSHKKQWEAGRTLVINALEDMGLISAEAIDRALRAAGGQETG